jgi:hypothetical protein
MFVRQHVQFYSRKFIISDVSVIYYIYYEHRNNIQIQYQITTSQIATYTIEHNGRERNAVSGVLWLDHELNTDIYRVIKNLCAPNDYNTESYR